MSWTDRFALLFNNALSYQFYVWPSTGVLIMILSLFAKPETSASEVKEGAVVHRPALWMLGRRLSNLGLALLVSSFPLLMMLVDTLVDKSVTMRGPVTLFLIQPIAGLYLIYRLNSSWINRLEKLGLVIAALVILQIIASFRILILTL